MKICTPILSEDNMDATDNMADFWKGAYMQN